MVINNFHVIRTIRSPYKTDAPLIVYANALLIFAITLQRLEVVARWHEKISQLDGIIQHLQFPCRNDFDIGKPASPLAIVERFGFITFE